ncbi:MAG: hypothetical protein LBR76_04365 [Oscillospiraceae bacterium]|nr:hypothetical protein [Oscillospiraceae bacterium]
MNRYKQLFDRVPENGKAERMALDAPNTVKPVRPIAQLAGSLVAICMAAALLWGVTTFLNTRTPPADNDNPVPGAAEDVTPQASPEVKAYPARAAEPADYSAYENIDDEFTPLQTPDEVYDMAYQRVYDIHREYNYPEYHSKKKSRETVNWLTAESVKLMNELGADEAPPEAVKARARCVVAEFSGLYAYKGRWRTSTDESTEMPWFDGTNADEPAVRYLLEDTPEANREMIQNWASMLAAQWEIYTQEGQGEFYLNEVYSLGGDGFDREWIYIPLPATDRPYGYSYELTDNRPTVYIFEMDVLEEQEYNYMLFSVPAGNGHGVFTTFGGSVGTSD